MCIPPGTWHLILIVAFYREILQIIQFQSEAIGLNLKEVILT